MTSDFAHCLRLDQIGERTQIEFSADAAECESIARRLGLASLDRFEGQALLSRDGPRVHATGRVLASLVQSCVVTGEPVATAVDEAFEVQFIPEPSAIKPDEEIELGSADCETVFFDGASVDLGAAAVDTLALALDPYPRSAGAKAALKEAGLIGQEEDGPFAALAALKDKLGDGP
ncbi:MAG: DUF177 domain-containing protein [Sphingomicrobium sp.]